MSVLLILSKDGSKGFIRSHDGIMDILISMGRGYKGGLELGWWKVYALREHLVEEPGIQLRIRLGGSFIIGDGVSGEEYGEH